MTKEKTKDELKEFELFECSIRALANQLYITVRINGLAKCL